MATQATLQDNCSNESSFATGNAFAAVEKKAAFQARILSPATPVKKPKVRSPRKTSPQATTMSSFVTPSASRSPVSPFGTRSRRKKERKDFDDMNFIAEQVHRLHPKDVLFGRGNGVAKFSGNLNFRALIFQFKPLYNASDRKDKQEVAQLLMTEIFESGGRFLEHMSHQQGPKEDDEGFVKDTFWTVSNHRALEKTCQALREKKTTYCPQPVVEEKKTAELKTTTKKKGTKRKKETPGKPGGTCTLAGRKNIKTCSRLVLKTSTHHNDKPNASPAKQQRPLIGDSNFNTTGTSICASPEEPAQKKMKKDTIPRISNKQWNHSTVSRSQRQKDSKKKRTNKKDKKGKKDEQRRRSKNSASSSTKKKSSPFDVTSPCSPFFNLSRAAAYPAPVTEEKPQPSALFPRSISNSTDSGTIPVPAAIHNDFPGFTVPPEFERLYSGALLDHCDDMMNHSHDLLEPFAPATTLGAQKRLPSFFRPGKRVSPSAAAVSLFPPLRGDDHLGPIQPRRLSFLWDEMLDENIDIAAGTAAEGGDQSTTPFACAATSISCWDETQENKTKTWESVPFQDVEWSMPTCLTPLVDSFSTGGGAEASSSVSLHASMMKRACSWVSFKDIEDPADRCSTSDNINCIVGDNDGMNHLILTGNEVPSDVCPTMLNYFFSEVYPGPEESAMGDLTHQITPNRDSGFESSNKAIKKEPAFPWTEEEHNDFTAATDKGDFDHDLLSHIDKNFRSPFAAANGYNQQQQPNHHQI